MVNRHANRRELLNYINAVSLACLEAQLYLDTHPEDERALAYFQEQSRQRNQALKEYAMCYGPLTIDGVIHSGLERWTWIQEPWPWQEGGC